MIKKKKAIECFNKVIELDPNYVNAYINKAAALIVLRKYEQAIKWYDKVIELDPKSALAYFNKGSALCIIGDNLSAMECFGKAIELEPDYFLAICVSKRREALKLLLLKDSDKASVLMKNSEGATTPQRLSKGDWKYIQQLLKEVESLKARLKDLDDQVVSKKVVHEFKSNFVNVITDLISQKLRTSDSLQQLEMIQNKEEGKGQENSDEITSLKGQVVAQQGQIDELYGQMKLLIEEGLNKNNLDVDKIKEIVSLRGEKKEK